MATRCDDGARFVQRKVLDYQRSSAKIHICPYCNEGFHQEPRLLDHAKKLHWDRLDPLQRQDDGQLRNQLRTPATEKASTATRESIRTTGHLPSRPTTEIGDDAGPRSPPMSVSTPGLGHFGSQVETPKRIDDLGKLTLGQAPTRPGTWDAPMNPFPSPNPLKRGPTENLEAQHLESKGHSTPHAASARRPEKALSAGSFPTVGPDVPRREALAKGENNPRNSYSSTKRMYSPYMDYASYNSDPTRKKPSMDQPGTIGRLPDFRPLKLPIESQPTSPNTGYNPTGAESSALADQNARRTKTSALGLRNGPPSWDSRHRTDLETQPRMLLQPETRPISHAQLVVEVKGIYHGLIMVEQKCIEVDEKQSAAALERDPSKRTDLKDEQWQALIALHKTLLHEHHDFFLASQHPSASPPLSKLASKYTMPARMWRHGIHAFLEVLRHRLPASLDHMLAFIYIAYSMMALLYETVTAFEDTWIECLGDLGRYRMAIEDSNTGDREIWGGVARSWYNKAADKRPEVGRLYHHLAILARPFSLSQLAYYTRSLSSVEPFDSARGSIMTLFQPILDGKTFNHQRVKALEVAYIKAHGVLFDRPQLEDLFQEIIASLRNGLLDGYIDRVTSNFKEQGLYIAIANIAAFFEYGGSRIGQGHRSVFWQAFAEAKKLRDEKPAAELQQPSDTAFSLDGDLKDESPHSPSAGTILPSSALPSGGETSSLLISKASELAFTTLSICLRRHGDKNVFPFVHCMFVFLWNLASIGSIMEYVRVDIPWDDICSFLNTLAKPETMTTAVLESDVFPKPTEQVERPLPEEFFMRGQMFALDYLPKDWFAANKVDEEERMLELPSMTATRVDRLLWLGIRMAKLNKWVYYDTVVHTFRPLPDESDAQ